MAEEAEYMTIGQVALALVSGLLGSIVGGLMTMWASMKTLRTNLANLEQSEIRRQKVECLVNVIGLRFVMSDPGAGRTSISTDADIARFMFEMNKVLILWSDDTAVLNNVRDCIRQMTIERLRNLIRSMARTTAFDLSNLNDGDLETVFQSTRPAPPPPPGFRSA